MKPVVFASAALLSFASLMGSGFAQENQSCNDPGLEQDITQMYNERPPTYISIIDITDEIPTSNLRTNAEGRILLSCEANILLSNSIYDHILYDVEVHNDGKVFTGYAIFPGKYAVYVPPQRYFEPPVEQIPTTPTQPLLDTTSTPPAYSSAFSQGLADRTAWEQWVVTLSGDYETGARFWAGQRSLPHPSSCNGVPMFTAGCIAAKERLTPTDVLRKINPEYRAGWNSYGHS